MNAKHILLPTDFSELSLRPIENAPELFEGKKVTLINVVESVPIVATSAPFAPPLEEPALHDRMDRARALLEEMAKTIPSAAEVQIEVVAGTGLGRTTAGWATENDVDLIALSTHGRTGLRRMFVGSVAESILRHSTVPVILFPAKAEAKES